MSNEQTNFTKSLSRFVQDAYVYSEKAYKAIFSNKENIPAALAYLQLASAKMSAAESLYYARYDLVEDDLETLFHQFDVFADELVTDFATNHSQQWTGFGFDDFKETFENSICAFKGKS